MRGAVIAHRSPHNRRRGFCYLSVIVWLTSTVHAQILPTEPVSFADGRVTISGDVLATVAPQESGFFNYTAYDHSALRMLQLNVAGSAVASDHLSVLGELRTQNFDAPQLMALYLRIRPWMRRALDIQVGRIPPTFGAFARRAYDDNPLIGYPLAYQYLTSLRADALPATADELLQMRGRGWRPTYSMGDPDGETGLPLAGGAFHWDTGAQVHVSTTVAEATAAITLGTVSNPALYDGNHGTQVIGRVVAHPTVGLVIGASAARGPFLTDSTKRILGPGNDQSGSFTQQAWGGDIEYSRGYYLVRSETVFSQWTIPLLAAPITAMPLRSVGTMIEARYKIRPGLYTAARIDYLGFSRIAGTSMEGPWDAPITRFEIAAGYSLQRNLVAKWSYQRDTRANTPIAEENLAAVQLRFRF
jgi:hypothetical protein